MLFHCALLAWNIMLLHCALLAWIFTFTIAFSCLIQRRKIQEAYDSREAYDSTKRYSLPNFDATENKAVKVYSYRGRDWSHSMELEQLPTFAELGKDPENEGIINDLLGFVRNKEFYKWKGKEWKRGYLLYDSPGTDRSSLIAAMAKCLGLDIHELDLTDLNAIWKIERALLSNKNRSLIAIKDFNHWFGIHPNLKNEVRSLRNENELTLLGLFEIMDELLQHCSDQQIVVLTTSNYQFHSALQRPLDIDAYMHTSSLQPVALPDGGEILELDSSEQKPSVDFDSTNNRAYQSSILVDNSEKENTGETSKRRCMQESVLSSDDSTTRKSLTDFDALDYRADPVRAYHSSPSMFTFENKDMREGLNGECLSKSVLSDDDSTKLALLLEHTSLAFFSSEEIDCFNDSGDSDSDNFDNGAAMLPNLKDVFVYGLSSCGNERIIVSTTDHRDRHDAALLPMDTYIHKASPQPVGLPEGGEIVQLQSIGEKSLVDFDATNNSQSVVLVSNSKNKYTLEVSRERCMTQSLLSLVESTRRIATDFDSPDSREHLNSPVVFNSEKEDTREASKGECSTKNALSLDDSTKQNSFPDFEATIHKAHLVEAYHSGPVVSLSENKNSAGALNRECIGKSVLCLEDLRQHCGGRCDDVEKSFGGISTLGSCVQQEKSLELPRVMQIDAVGQRVTKSSRYLEGFTAQNLVTWKGYFLGGERPDDVISVFLLIDISGLGRFSPRSPALPPEGEIVEPPLALSSSQLPSTGIRAHLGGQDQSGSSTSHSQNERTRDQAEGRKRKIKNLTIEDLRPYVRLPRAQAARELQMSESSFKRLCRRLKIEQWPKLPPGEEILKPPDPPGRNAGQIGMVNESGHLPEPIEVSRPPDPCERNTGQTEEENDVQNLLQDNFDSPIGWSEGNDSTDLRCVLQGIEVDQMIDELLLFGAYPNPNPDVFLQPQVALTQMVSGNMGIPNNRRNSLASPAETRLEGHGAGSSNHCPNPNPDVFLQPQVSLTHMVSGNMGIPNNRRNSLASPAETRLEGHGAVSSNHCLNPNPDVFLQPQVALTHMVSGNMGIPNNQRNSLASPVFMQPQVALTQMVSGNRVIPNNQRNSLASPAETRLEGHGIVSSNQAMIQPMSTLPQMTPSSTSSKDMSSVMLKVYGLGKRIIFLFPLTSGINELKEEVAMRFNLQKDSFDMNYKDDEGENIFIPLDVDLRYHLTKPTSSVNSVIKLWVVNKDANPTNLCGSCGGSLMR